MLLPGPCFLFWHHVSLLNAPVPLWPSTTPFLNSLSPSLLHEPQEHAAHLRKEEINGVLFSSDLGVFCPVVPC